MKRHHRRVRQIVAVLREQIEDRVLARGMRGHTSPSTQRQRREPVAVLIGKRRTQLEEELEALRRSSVSHAPMTIPGSSFAPCACSQRAHSILPCSSARSNAC